MEIKKMENRVALKQRELLIITKMNTRIVFTQHKEGTFLSEITSINGDHSHNFLRQPTLLWAVEMTNTDKTHTALDMTGIIPEVTEKSDMEQYLTWRNVPIEETEESVKVTVSIRFNASNQIEWQIFIEEIPPQWSVFRVRFPRIDLAVEENDDYTLVAPFDRGMAYVNPLKTLPKGGWYEELRIRPYPFDGFSMQFMALQRREEMLYMAAHDPKPVVKNFYYGPDRDNKLIYFHPYVDTLVKYGCDYRQSFPWITACTKGDWYDAAQIYRKFALTASWTIRGPLVKGKKTPLWYQNIPIVALKLMSGPEYEVEDIIKEKEFIGLPMVSHYYMWHRNAFDAKYPFFFPTAPDFRKSVEKLRKHEIYVMPYVNPYSADATTAEWKNGLKDSACVRNEQGELKIETYSQNLKFAVMCPAAPLWKRIVNLVAMRLFDMGIPAVYHDQLSQSGPWPCYSDNHDHIAGGGDNFIEPQLAYLKQLKEETENFNTKTINTAEGCAEPYMLHLDAFLTGNYNSPNEIPLFEAVYHDYMMSFGRYTFTQELTDPKFNGAIILKHAQQFIWGSQFGWSRVPLSAIIQKDPDTAEFLRHLAHVRVNNSNYLVQGKMLRPLDLSSQFQLITRRWAQSWSDNEGLEIETLPILNSVWQAYDGSIAVVLVNITDSPIEMTVKLPSVFDKITKKNSEKLMADNFEVDQENESIFYSTDFYPIPSQSIGQLQTHDGTNLNTSICDGDSHTGFKVKIQGYKSAVISIGSEKGYGL